MLQLQGCAQIGAPANTIAASMLLAAKLAAKERDWVVPVAEHIV